MKGGHAGGQPDEERQRMHSECEDQPAEQADPRKGENESEGKHGGGSMTKMDGRAFHHHHGATRSIANDEQLWEGEFIAADRLLT
jgi:hypothetical protein